MTSDAEREAALRIIANMRAALKNGVRHFDLRGKFLATELEITDALQQDGRVTFDATARVERTTEAKELALARSEFAHVE